MEPKRHTRRMKRASTRPPLPPSNNASFRRKLEMRKRKIKSESNNDWWASIGQCRHRVRSISHTLWHGPLARKRVVGILNFTVLIMLVWQTISIIRMRGEVDLGRYVLESMNAEELPYPLNIVVQVHQRNITKGLGRGKSGFAGYAVKKDGTFRTKYPSVDISGRGTFDGVYVLSNPKCSRIWKEWERRAAALGWNYMKRDVEDWKTLALSDLPMGMRKEIESKNKGSLAMTKRHVRYFEAQRKLWEHVVEMRQQRVLVLDEWLFPTRKLLENLPRILTNVDQESIARQRAWHVIYLRRRRIGIRDEAVWCVDKGWNGRVVVADRSVGMGAYILSLEGARELLKRVEEGRGGVDVDVGMAQINSENGSEGLLALGGGCVVDEGRGCGGMWEQVGGGKRSGMDCEWRRLVERKSLETLKRMSA